MPLILMLIYSALNWEMVSTQCVGKESACCVSLFPRSSAVETFLFVQPHCPQPGYYLPSSSPRSDFRALGGGWGGGVVIQTNNSESLLPGNLSISPFFDTGLPLRWFTSEAEMW